MANAQGPRGPGDPSHGAPPEVRETHISLLVFVGDRVYKLRKAVDLGFVDFREEAAREADCRREVELNSRLAPDVYLGVASVIDFDETVAHLVVMRRLPEERSLAALVAAGAARREDVEQVARVLAAFHGRAERSPEISAAGTRGAIRARLERLFEGLDGFVGPIIEADDAAEVRRLVASYLDGRAALFEKRVRDGRIVDGHGDLQAADIFCMPDGPRVLDCIEFDDRLRHLDVLDDVAFLVMDLERLGAGELAEALVSRYAALTGDRFALSLLDFYVAGRALVRCLVACVRSSQTTGEPSARAAAAARLLHGACRRHLEAATVRLVAVGGLPGTGKSTLAAALAGDSATLLVSDEIRRELRGAPGAEPSGDRYSEEATAEVYRVMLERAGRALSLGESVVLDATWRDAGQREQLRELARHAAGGLTELCCTCPADLAIGRIEQRMARAAGPSEATPAVRRLLEQRFDAWPEATEIDTSTRLADSLAAARAASVRWGK
ncbi:MAG TPA: AAA family ATPase [Acidimicrobiales bacterium]|nr:AAA family ATPase [Acidimicrobiales bacterium]